jgi:hypothetical protein
MPRSVERPSDLGAARQLWAPIGSITTALAEVLCYNELTVPDPLRPSETMRIVPECFYVQGSQIKYLRFSQAERSRVALFHRAGLFTALMPANWNNQMSPYTIRRMGEDPKSWVDQTLGAFSSFSRNLLSMSTAIDPLQLEAEVLVHVHEMMQEVFALHIGNLVCVEDRSFPAMLHRVYSLYGATVDYEATCVPCSKRKPCLLLACANCCCDEEYTTVRRNAARVFLSLSCSTPSAPEFVKEIWRRPVVCKV